VNNSLRERYFNAGFLKIMLDPLDKRVLDPAFVLDLVYLNDNRKFDGRIPEILVAYNRVIFLFANPLILNNFLGRLRRDILGFLKVRVIGNANAD